MTRIASLLVPVFKTLLWLPVILLATAVASGAVVFENINGIDCSGVFGQGFDNCTVDGSPSIIKFVGALDAVDDSNSAFPTIDGTEFTFSGLGTDNSTGTWTYTPNDPEDPAIRFWVAKAGNGFNLFYDGTSGDRSSSVPVFTGTWSTPQEKGLSHITFYNTGREVQIPEPSSLLLLGAGLSGLLFALLRGRC